MKVAEEASQGSKVLVRGGDRSLWFENWTSTGVIWNDLNENPSIPDLTIKDFINNKFLYLHELQDLLPLDVLRTLEHFDETLVPGCDLLIWQHSSSGSFTFKSAYLRLRKRGLEDYFSKNYWHKLIPLEEVNLLVVLNNWWNRGSFSSDLKALIKIILSLILWEIWKMRNKMLFEGEKFNREKVILATKVHICNVLMTHDLQAQNVEERNWIENNFGFQLQKVRMKTCMAVRWKASKGSDYVFNIDGSLINSDSGYGFCIRKRNGSSVYGESGYLGRGDSFDAEVYGVLFGVQKCCQLGLEKVDIQTDNKDEEFAEKDDVVDCVKGMSLANDMIINVVSGKRKNGVLMRCFKGGKVKGSLEDCEKYVSTDSKTQITGCKFKVYVHSVSGRWRIYVYPANGYKKYNPIFRYKLEYSRQKIGTHYCGFPLNRLKCQVSHTCSEKLNTEWLKTQEWKKEVNDRCDHVVYWTCRIPCVCALKKAADAGTSITLKHIHPFWATVNIGEQAATGGSTDVDDDVLYTTQLMEELNECPKAVRRTTNRAFHDIMHLDQCGFKQPEEVKRRKGRPKGAKSKIKATLNVWDYRDDTLGKSTTVTSDSSKKRPSSSGGRKNASTGPPCRKKSVVYGGVD
ncbi:OLC1v1016267C1 [Oldenlandia corymbosa var. corymbosa]|uniref:OLC1v1016267C1 n=1 Tax=Oldenlandia corymbosa var. corymbosa TaxID=529605 RepID=A0AAV1E5L1_OLDCO|nr:OLC1v1016267C1 [Oldenlandia corymbosa var. corymbosa]